MKTTNGMAALALAGALLQGCATGAVDKRIDQKLAQEPATSQGELGEKASVLIQEQQDLTADQKSRLLALQKATQERMTGLTQEASKLRALLIQDVLAPGYDAKEIRGVKKRIEKVERARLATMFEAVDRAVAILGRESGRNERFVRELMEYHGWGF